MITVVDATTLGLDPPLSTLIQVWHDGVTNKGQPASLSEWNAGVKMLVNTWLTGKGFCAFDFANAGYQVKDDHNYKLRSCVFRTIFMLSLVAVSSSLRVETSYKLVS